MERVFAIRQMEVTPMKTNTVPGPAAQLIDSCYEMKLSLCVATDDALSAFLGLKVAGIWSFTGFLNVCYDIRRPFFVMTDQALGLSNARSE
jgi:hypothetical protein